MSYEPSPSYPYPPRQPNPTHPYPAHQPGPPHLTYPWQPQQPAPEPAPRRTPPPALGNHSDLRILRSASRWQRRVAGLTALGYFSLFLILSAFAPSFMTSRAVDGLPTGLLLALAQLPVTWLAIALYEHTARRYVDPLADRIRRLAEVDARREAGR
ncbi:DUF485 domain-containing protein [Streptomyces sp. NPDC020800]|uniref:DUF485 domain-containing protein n=1 Tax=Streptomyces sp. NPDC020800 TaxID=3365092 RepID=UPI003791D905